MMVRFAMMSTADTCIIPIQDYLLSGNEARINLPSTLGTNWRWRLMPDQIDDDVIKKIKALTLISFRAGKYAKKKKKKKDKKGGSDEVKKDE